MVYKAVVVDKDYGSVSYEELQRVKEAYAAAGIELELALFSLSEPAQQPVYAAAAAPARAAGIWTNTAAVWRWRVSAFWSRRAAAHRAPPPCWALMMNAGLSCAMTVKAALLP